MIIKYRKELAFFLAHSGIPSAQEVTVEAQAATEKP
ncbi:MAG: hypothetical protein RLZZ419_1255 [Pseudomonadota bacterium]|jgi:hypothetical protein